MARRRLAACSCVSRGRLTTLRAISSRVVSISLAICAVVVLTSRAVSSKRLMSFERTSLISVTVASDTARTTSSVRDFSLSASTRTAANCSLSAWLALPVVSFISALIAAVRPSTTSRASAIRPANTSATVCTSLNRSFNAAVSASIFSRREAKSIPKRCSTWLSIPVALSSISTCSRVTVDTARVLSSS